MTLFAIRGALLSLQPTSPPHLGPQPKDISHSTSNSASIHTCHRMVRGVGGPATIQLFATTYQHTGIQQPDKANFDDNSNNIKHPTL
jgi:hypothetical protein